MKAAVIFCEGGPSCIHASLTTSLSASPSCPTVGTRPKAQTHTRPGRTNSRQSRFITPLPFSFDESPGARTAPSRRRRSQVLLGRQSCAGYAAGYLQGQRQTIRRPRRRLDARRRVPRLPALVGEFPAAHVRVAALRLGLVRPLPARVRRPLLADATQ